MSNRLIELPDDVALNVLVELETNARRAAQDVLAPNLTDVTRETRKRFSDEATAAYAAYRDAFRASKFI